LDFKKDHLMKYIFTSLAIGALTISSACQSNNSNTGNAQHPAEHQMDQQQPSATSQPVLPMTKEPAKQLPDFKFYKVKSGIGFTKADIPANRNTVFILFDPSCGHCQQETGLLAKNYEKLKDVNLYFISMNDPSLMASFLETFGKELVDKPNVEVLYDRNQEFIQKFHVPAQFPANYIYGSNGTLKNNWDGEKSIDFVIAEFTK
jgi:thiol-disulfide isomerase/thioredoxin